MMTPSHGNMYPWITHCKNYIGGLCPHGCIYCYVTAMSKRFPNMRKRYGGKPFLIENELSENMKSGRTIFIQNCGDLFAVGIPNNWIENVLLHCRLYNRNTYLFQSKNPSRIEEFLDQLPKKSIIGTTIETNRFPDGLTKAPKPTNRARSMAVISDIGIPTMVSIEPILDFDLRPLLELIRNIHPKFVSIGADSKNHGLDEPSPNKIKSLLKGLRSITEVKVKKNLGRLTDGS